MNAPLVVTKDPGLVETILGCAAVAGVTPVITRDIARVRALWTRAASVIVGTDGAARVVGAGLPSRDEVYLCGTSAQELIRWSVPLAARVIELPGQRGLVTAILGDTPRLGERARVIQVSGGSGGVGASSLAAGLAVVAARRGQQTVLVETDPCGGGIDLMFSAEDEPGWRWPDLRTASGHIDDPGASLPEVCGVRLLAMGRSPVGDSATTPLVPDQAAQAAVFAALARSHDLLVVDAGHHPVTSLSGEVVVVVAAEVRAVVAARTRLVGQRATASGVVVRTGRGRHLAPEVVAESLGIGLVGSVGDDARVASGAEAGDPPARRRGRFARACERILGEVLG